MQLPPTLLHAIKFYHTHTYSVTFFWNFNHQKSLASLHTANSIKSKGFNYGFIEYDDPGAAERAMATLNGRRVHQAVSSKTAGAGFPEHDIYHFLGNSRELGISVK